MTSVICGFALVTGLWNIWTYRATRSAWFWLGIAMVILALVVFFGNAWLISQGRV